MVKYEWTESVENTLNIIRQNLDQLASLTLNNYNALKNRINYVNFPLAVLSGLNGAAVIWLDNYISDTYVTIACASSSVLIASALAFDWCSGSMTKLELDLSFSKECENLSKQIKEILDIPRESRKIDGNMFINSIFEKYKGLVLVHPIITKFNGHLKETVSEQVEDMQEFVKDHWNILFRPTLRRFKKKNEKLLTIMEEKGQDVKEVIEPVKEEAKYWMSRIWNFRWNAEKEESNDGDNSGKESPTFLDIQSIYQPKEEVKDTNTVIELKQPSASVNEQKVVQRSVSPPVNITKKFNMSFMNI